MRLFPFLIRAFTLQLLEEMREDCDGRHSIDMLDDENCRDEDNDDLHKILALSNPFRRIDGE